MSLGRLEHHLWSEHRRATVLYAIHACGHSRQEVAKWIGIGTSTLATLLSGGELSGQSEGRVHDWCERYGMVGAWTEQAALSVLVEGFPVADRNHAREVFTRWFRARVARSGAAAPDWVVAELNALRFLRRTKRVRGAV